MVYLRDAAGVLFRRQVQCSTANRSVKRPLAVDKVQSVTRLRAYPGVPMPGKLIDKRTVDAHGLTPPKL